MKTYNQFLNTPFSEEVKPPEPQEEDPGIKSKEKRQMQIKKQVLLKKMQAVRAGAGADIVASHTPDGELVEGDVHSGQGEKIQKRTKKWMEKKGQKGAPGLDAMKARTAEHKAKRGVKEETIDESPYGYSDRDFNMLTTVAKNPRGSKVSYDKKGKKVVTSKDGKTLKHKFDKEGRAHYGEGTDKAFEYVKKQIAAKYGKSGYVSKDNPRKPQTAAEKKKVAAHKAKLAKQDHRDPTEKASDGRYSDRHSNRGSD